MLRSSPRFTKFGWPEADDGLTVIPVDEVLGRADAEIASLVIAVRGEGNGTAGLDGQTSGCAIGSPKRNLSHAVLDRIKHSIGPSFYYFSACNESDWLIHWNGSVRLRNTVGCVNEI